MILQPKDNNMSRKARKERKEKKRTLRDIFLRLKINILVHDTCHFCINCIPVAGISDIQSKLPVDNIPSFVLVDTRKELSLNACFTGFWFVIKIQSCEISNFPVTCLFCLRSFYLAHVSLKPNAFRKAAGEANSWFRIILFPLFSR